MRIIYYVAIVFTGLFLFMNWAFAEDCVTDEIGDVKEVVEDINTDVPKHLKGAKVCIFKETSGYNCVPAEKFKVVPRKQQFKTVERSKVNRVTCTMTVAANEKKNLITVGARNDYKGLDKSVEPVAGGTEVTLSARKGIVLDAMYMRRNIKDSNLGLGAGIDTNGTIKGAVGLDF